jgi:hypothetical protein
VPRGRLSDERQKLERTAAGPSPPFRFLAAILVLGFFAVAAQTWLLSTDRIPRSADQAVVGLIARHILEGKGHPVFYWGATYAGTLEPHFVAAVFLLLGPTPTAYRVAMGTLVWAILGGVGFLSFRAFGRRAAFVSLLYLAVPPFFFPYKGFTSDGAYATVMLAAALSLLFALEADARLRKGASPTLPMLLLGLVAGAGFWVTPVTLPVSSAAALWLLFRQRPRPALRSALALAGGIAGGSFPWWIWNLRHDWASLSANEIRAVNVEGLLRNGWAFLVKSIPVLTGAAVPLFTDNRREPFPFASIAVPSVLCLFLIPPLVQAVKGDRTVRLFFLAFGFVIVATVGSGRFLATEPRYAVALYAIVPPLLGTSVVSLLGGPRRVLAIAGGAFLLAANAGSLAMARRHLPENMNDDEVTASLGELPATLLRLGANRVYTNYWTAYRLDFESGERIVATPIPAEDQTRWEPYRDAVTAAKNPGVVLLPPRDGCFERYLVETGEPFGVESADRFRIFFDLPGPVLGALRRSGSLPLPKDAYRVAWKVIAAPATIAPGGSAPASVVATNEGPCVFMPNVHLGYRFLPASGGAPVDMPQHAFPNRRVAPGESIRFDLTVTAPPAPGRYDLEFDLVQEDVAWFSWKGGATARIPVEVR